MSQHNGLPLCRGTRVGHPDVYRLFGIPNRLFGGRNISWRKKNDQVVRSIMSRWSTRSLLANEAVNPHRCQLENSNGTDEGHKRAKIQSQSRPTATCTTSSSSRRPQEAMGKANSQSPQWGDDAARNDIRWCAEFKLASTDALSFSTHGRSQNGCLVGKTFGTSSSCADQSDKCDCK